MELHSLKVAETKPSLLGTKPNLAACIAFLARTFLFYAMLQHLESRTIHIHKIVMEYKTLFHIMIMTFAVGQVTRTDGSLGVRLDGNVVQTDPLCEGRKQTFCHTWQPM